MLAVGREVLTPNVCDTWADTVSLINMCVTKLCMQKCPISHHIFWVQTNGGQHKCVGSQRCHLINGVLQTWPWLWTQFCVQFR
ncbi:hypothetical protein K439DRAFT_191915 [Ramaria rubella]|nr:hypothetical protein K439DRAFT_191915 [Ramaria rubella]